MLSVGTPTPKHQINYVACHFSKFWVHPNDDPKQIELACIVLCHMVEAL
jgi:hypothetical protein